MNYKQSYIKEIIEWKVFDEERVEKCSDSFIKDKDFQENATFLLYEKNEENQKTEEISTEKSDLNEENDFMDFTKEMEKEMEMEMEKEMEKEMENEKEMEMEMEKSIETKKGKGKGKGKKDLKTEKKIPIMDLTGDESIETKKRKGKKNLKTEINVMDLTGDENVETKKGKGKEKITYDVMCHDLPIDFSKLDGYLNDAIITAFGEIIMKEENDPQIAFISSTTFNSIRLNYVQKKLPSKVRKVISVINPGFHWFCLAIDLDTKKVSILDSIRKEVSVYNEDIKILQNYVCSPKTTLSLPNARQLQSIPQQTDGHSCGVYTCYFLECLITKKPVKQNFNCPEYRIYIKNKILEHADKD